MRTFLPLVIVFSTVAWSCPLIGEERLQVELRPPTDAASDEDQQSAPTARPLPREVTICRGQQGCWTEAGRSSCQGDESGSGTPYVLLPVDESDNLARALQDCWKQRRER